MTKTGNYDLLLKCFYQFLHVLFSTHTPNVRQAMTVWQSVWQAITINIIITIIIQLLLSFLILVCC